MRDKGKSRSNQAKSSMAKVNTIDETEESEEVDPDGYGERTSRSISTTLPEVDAEIKLFTRDLKGLIFVADD
jgi:hypothetical protein